MPSAQSYLRISDSCYNVPTSGTKALSHYRLIWKKLPKNSELAQPASTASYSLWGSETGNCVGGWVTAVIKLTAAPNHLDPAPPPKKEDLWPGFNHMVSGQLLSFLISRWSSLGIFSDHLPNMAVGFPQGEMSQEGEFKLKSSGFNNFILKVRILPGIFCLWRAWMQEGGGREGTTMWRSNRTAGTRHFV